MLSSKKYGWLRCTSSLAHSLTQFDPSTVPCTYCLTACLTHSVSLSAVLPLTRSLTHLLNHSFSHSLTYSITLSLTHSLTHLFRQRCLLACIWRTLKGTFKGKRNIYLEVFRRISKLYLEGVSDDIKSICFGGPFRDGKGGVKENLHDI